MEVASTAVLHENFSFLNTSEHMGGIGNDRKKRRSVERTLNGKHENCVKYTVNARCDGTKLPI
jgi:hypothetical protein